MVSDGSVPQLSSHAQKAHAFLFSEGGALSWKRLAHLIGCTEGEAREAASELADHLRASGLSILSTEREVSLATGPEVQEAIRAAYESQLQRDIGDAGLEVIAILLYRGPSTRAQIDYIRGVNTTSTIRTLLARGLVEREISQGDAREYVYTATAELLGYLGVSKSEQLPDYDTIRNELDAFEDSKTPFDDYAGGESDDARGTDT